MVDLYWKCYACGDKLKPHVKFLDDIVLSSTRHVSRILMISMCERCVGLKVLKDRPVLKSATSTSSAILLRVPTLPWMRTIAAKSTRRMGSFPKKTSFLCQSLHHNQVSAMANLSREVVYISAVLQDNNTEWWNGEDKIERPTEWVSYYYPGVELPIVRKPLTI